MFSEESDISYVKVKRSDPDVPIHDQITFKHQNK